MVKFGLKEFEEIVRGTHRIDIKQFIISTVTAKELISIIEFARQYDYYIPEGVKDLLEELKIFVD